MPVVDEHIFLGAAVAYLRRDGYGEIVDDGRARQFNRVGQDVSDKDVLAARANATFVWGDSSAPAHPRRYGAGQLQCHRRPALDNLTVGPDPPRARIRA